MKTALVFLCFSVCAFAQQKINNGQSADQLRLPAACGPANVSFKVSLDQGQHGPAPIEAGKAVIYFIHDVGIPSAARGWGYPTTRYALDGSWVGAAHGGSWFELPVEPGEHHICATLQTALVDQRVELAHLTAEAGKTYYFRTRLVLSGQVELLELNQTDSDEGEYAVSEYPMATAHARK